MLSLLLDVPVDSLAIHIIHHLACEDSVGKQMHVRLHRNEVNGNGKHEAPNASGEQNRGVFVEAAHGSRRVCCFRPPINIFLLTPWLCCEFLYCRGCWLAYLH